MKLGAATLDIGRKNVLLVNFLFHYVCSLLKNIIASLKVIIILHTTVQNDKLEVDKVWYSMYNIKGVKQSVFTLFINGYGNRVA